MVISTAILSLYAILNALREPTIFRITLPVKKDFLDNFHKRSVNKPAGQARAQKILFTILSKHDKKIIIIIINVMADKPY